LRIWKLTPEVTTRVYRISLHVDGLGPDQASTTENATATVSGTVSSAGLTSGAPAPYVGYAAYELDAHEQPGAPERSDRLFNDAPAPLLGGLQDVR